LDGYAVDLAVPFFHEFVVGCPRPVSEVNRYLLDEHDILGGYDLSQAYPELENQMLLCVTEMNSADEIDALVQALEELGP
jgi:glycine dehydrogenase subunit 1